MHECSGLRTRSRVARMFGAIVCAGQCNHAANVCAVARRMRDARPGAGYGLARGWAATGSMGSTDALKMINFIKY